MATLNTHFLDRIVLASMAQVRSIRSPAWSESEDQFLREHLAMMTDAEIGEQLGRSEIAVHLRWSRDLHLPSRSKHPEVITANQAADMLGIDDHKTAYWVDCGLIPGRLMPGERKMRLIRRQDFRRWVLNPMNWPYFDIRKVNDAELKRMLRKRAARWGDEWWSTRQVADYHGVDPKDVERYIKKLGRLHSFHLPVSRGGRNIDRGWSNHYVLKSEAIGVTFKKGKGNHMPCKFTPAADAWILKARDELMMTFIEIGRTMKIGRVKRRGTNSTIAYRYHLLKAGIAARKPRRRRKP